MQGAAHASGRPAGQFHRAGVVTTYTLQPPNNAARAGYFAVQQCVLTGSPDPMLVMLFCRLMPYSWLEKLCGSRRPGAQVHPS